MAGGWGLTEKLGPVSKALLDIVNKTFGYVNLGKLHYEVFNRTGEHRTDNWIFRRLVALALEGHIEGVVYRNGDKVTIRFRRKKEG